MILTNETPPRGDNIFTDLAPEGFSGTEPPFSPQVPYKFHLKPAAIECPVKIQYMRLK